MEGLILGLILLGVYLISLGAMLILRAMKKTDLALFFEVFPVVNTVCLFLWILFKLFDNEN